MARPYDTETHSCIYNDAVICYLISPPDQRLRCMNCGWNPKVAKKRHAELVAALKQEEEEFTFLIVRD